VRDLPGRKVTVTTPGGRVGETFYDAFGRVTESRYGGLAPVTYAYDARGRVETVSQGSRTTSYDYGTDGLLASVTDPLSREVSFTRDAAGRVTTQTLSDGREVHFAYDPAGNLTSITPPGRPAHAFTHTAVDLPRDYTAPDAGAGADVTTLDYDLDRRLTRVTRPGGEMMNYAYHPVTHRLSSVTTPQGVYGYSYDPTTGNLTTATDPDGGSLTYTYDGSLPLAVAWSGEVAGSVEQVYDHDFRVASRTVNGLDPVAFAYEADGFLTQAGALALAHDPVSGLLTGTTLDTITDALSYNAFGEPTAYTASYSGADFYAVTYTRDAAGRIASKTETIGGVSDSYAYTYDLAGRLTEVTKNGAAYASYTYDANSNRTAWTDPWGSGSATYDAQDRLLTYGGATYTYAPGGELATKTANGQTATFDYDALGNLRSVVLPNGIAIDYVIDAANRRVGKKINGTLVQGFLYGDQLNPVAELDGLGAVVSRFVYGTTGHVPDYMVKGGVTYRIVSDHLGSVRLVVNTGDGSVAQRLDYDAFGRVLTDTNPGFQPFAFAGGIYDHQTGLVRFGARDYDPETGRWTAKDPIGFAAGDTNLYGYVLADPINAVDPSGLFSLLDGLQLGLDIIGLIPGLGEVADIANGLISLARGDCVGAALSFAAAVPFAGAVATAAKWGRRGLKYADEVLSITDDTSTAISTLRRTRAGENFTHYGYSEHAASFEGGLRPGSYATSASDLSGSQAHSGLALPHAAPPDAAYTVSPPEGTWIEVNPITRADFGQPGGLPEVFFPFGTGPGTVSGPLPVSP
jgi:RHS repeat-associated protein